MLVSKSLLCILSKLFIICNSSKSESIVESSFSLIQGKDNTNDIKQSMTDQLIEKHPLEKEIEAVIETRDTQLLKVIINASECLFPNNIIEIIKEYEHPISFDDLLYKKVIMPLKEETVITNHKREEENILNFFNAEFAKNLYQKISLKRHELDNFNLFWYDLPRLLFKWMIYMRRTTVNRFEFENEILKDIEPLSHIIKEEINIDLSIIFGKEEFMEFNKIIPLIDLMNCELLEDPILFHSFNSSVKSGDGRDDDQPKILDNNDFYMRFKLFIHYIRGEVDLESDYFLLNGDNQTFIESNSSFDYRMTLSPKDFQIFTLEFVSNSTIETFLKNGWKFRVCDSDDLFIILKKLKEAGKLSNKPLYEVIEFELVMTDQEDAEEGLFPNTIKKEEENTDANKNKNNQNDEKRNIDNVTDTTVSIAIATTSINNNMTSSDKQQEKIQREEERYYRWDQERFKYFLKDQIKRNPLVKDECFEYLELIIHEKSLDDLYISVMNKLKIKKNQRKNLHFNNSNFATRLFLLLKVKQKSTLSPSLLTLSVGNDDSFWHDLTRLLFKWKVHMDQVLCGKELERALKHVESILKIIHEERRDLERVIPSSFVLKSFEKKDDETIAIRDLINCELMENSHVFYSFEFVIKKFYIENISCDNLKIDLFGGDYDNNPLLKFMIIFYDPRKLIVAECFPEYEYSSISCLLVDSLSLEEEGEKEKEREKQEMMEINFDYLERIILKGPEGVTKISNIGFISSSMIEFCLESNQGFFTRDSDSLLKLLRKLKEKIKVLTGKILKTLIEFESYRSEKSPLNGWNKRYFEASLFWLNSQKSIEKSEYEYYLELVEGSE